MSAGVVIAVVLMLVVIAFLSVVGYKWNQCKNRDGKSSNVASYVYSFPFTCSANTCVDGFSLDSTGNCVATTNTWMDNTDVHGISLTTFQNSSLSDCQTQCMNNADCDVAQFYKSSSKCVLRSQKKFPDNYCTSVNPDTQLFQKPGGAVPPKC
jgi:hypothetical protein